MSNRNDPLLFDHEIDGIRELDNTLPKWWLYLFYITIAFAAVYLVYYHLARMGPLQEAMFEQEVARAETRLAAVREAEAARIPFTEGDGSGAPAPTEDFSQPSTDALVLNAGKKIFDVNCMPCHGPEGQGMIGPNMTDNYFIHGAAFADSVHIINVGVLEKGMIAWNTVLKEKEIHAVASYVYSLRGTNPNNPAFPNKYPEGKDPDGNAAPPPPEGAVNPTAG